MRLPITPDNPASGISDVDRQQHSVEVTGKALAAVVAPPIIGALLTLATSMYTIDHVTEPQNDADKTFKDNAQNLEKQKFELDQELKKQSQLLEKQRFQSELLQSALQGENSKQRAQALRMLVDMKLLDIPRSLMTDFIKNPNTVPQFSPQSTGKPKPPSTPVSGKPIASK